MAMAMTSAKRETGRAAFETAAFDQRFLSSIKCTKPGEFGPVGIYLMPKDCPSKDEFLEKRENGEYVDDSLNAAWWAWQECERRLRQLEQPSELADVIADLELEVVYHREHGFPQTVERLNRAVELLRRPPAQGPEWRPTVTQYRSLRPNPSGRTG